jgi:chemotaxis protein methyltransferase WspC
MSARALLQRATGLNLSEADAARAVTRRMDALGIEDADAYLRQMAPSELHALIELVVVPESWMFRDADAFAAAVGFIKARLLAAPTRVLRIASVPCAGGEEPYSMAMALADAGVGAACTHIDGYDLSTASIARARAGRYGRNAFRGRRLEFRSRHFSAAGDDFQISAALRAQVEFRQGNLFELDSAVAGGRYDVLFCRNLLIYFDEPTTAAAIARIDGLLAADGIVFAGYAEVPAFCRNGFSPLPLPGAFALRRGAALPSSTRALAQASAGAPTRGRARLPIPARTPPTPISAATAAAAASSVAARRANAPAAPARRATDTAFAAARSPAPADNASMLAAARKQADQGDYRGAAASCQAVLACDADSADAYYLLGVVSDCQQHNALAEDYWKRCVYLKPNHYEALCQLALLAEQTGNAAQASAFKQRAARVFQRDERAVKGRP